MDKPILFIRPSVDIWVVSTLWLFVNSAAMIICLVKRMGAFGEETVLLLLKTKETCPQVQAAMQLGTLELEVPSTPFVVVCDGLCDISLELLQVLGWLFRLHMPGDESFTLTSEMELIK